MSQAKGVPPLKKSQLRFRKNANIGAADADDDGTYLLETFQDTGSLAIIRDVEDPRSILVGRTGSGKTALIKYLHSWEERAIRLEPKNLALNYIASNGTINFFIAAGVNMDLFYSLLWRHIFAVEILRRHYGIKEEDPSRTLAERLRDIVAGDRTKQKAMDYLANFGSSFWEETDIRVKEIVNKTSKELGAKLTGGAGFVAEGLPVNGGLDARAARVLSSEQRMEVRELGQRVINQVQMAELGRIISILAEDILTDPQKHYFITIDKLDEEWVTEDLRYPFIRALLDTVATFNSNIYSLKIAVALREDLVGRVFRFANPSGHQSEKVESRTLRLSWEKEELLKLIDARLNKLARETYTTQAISLRDILPKHIDGKDPIEYIFERTMMRPRDAILFVNECLQASEGKVQVSRADFMRAEEVYSSKRLEALRDEWRVEHPDLAELCRCFKKFPKKFKVSDVCDIFCENAYLYLMKSESEVNRESYIYQTLFEHFNLDDKRTMLIESIKILHLVGFIGIKADSFLTTYWAYLGQRVKNFDEGSVFSIHPAFWRVLGIRP